MEGVNQLKDITLEYASSTGFLLYVYTDMPGDALALRATLQFAASGGTGPANVVTKTFPLDGIEGKLIKPQAVSISGGNTVLLGGLVRRRKVGTYLRGDVSELWDPGPIALGA